MERFSNRGTIDLHCENKAGANTVLRVKHKVAGAGEAFSPTSIGEARVTKYHVSVRITTSMDYVFYLIISNTYFRQMRSVFTNFCTPYISDDLRRAKVRPVSTGRLLT